MRLLDYAFLLSSPPPARRHADGRAAAHEDLEMSMSLKDILRDMGQTTDEPEVPIDPVAAVATLREVHDRYAAGCPFKPGDLVTPRKAHGLRGEGDPHVVLYVPDTPIWTFGGDPDASARSSYGRRLDIRVASISRGEVAAYWSESWEYEPYAEPAA